MMPTGLSSILGVLALLTTVSAKASSPSCLIRHAVWLSVEEEWQKPIPDSDLRTAKANLLSFHHDGGFVLVRCLLNRVRENVNISLGDGVSKFQGSWQVRGATIAVKYSLVERIPRVLKAPTHPSGVFDKLVRVDAEGDCRNAVVTFEGRRYLPARTLDPKDVMQFFRVQKQPRH